MLSRNLKGFTTSLVLGTYLMLNTNMNAQIKSDVKTSLTTKELSQFLSVHNYIKVPMSKLLSGHLHINAKLNGIDGNFILDTGAGATVIDSKASEKFKLKSEKSDGIGVGAGGAQGLQAATNNSFVSGDFTKNNFSVYVMNLDHVNKAFTQLGIKEVDGVIGADLLQQNKAVIDYSNLILYLQK